MLCRTLKFVVRTTQDPANLIPTVRSIAADLDKDQPLFSIATMKEMIASSVRAPRFRAIVLASFAGLALVLAAVGIYGVLRYSAAQRELEIGISMALGAAPADIRRLVLRWGMEPVVIGIAVGFLATLGLARVVTAFVFGIEPYDPMMFLGASALIVAISLATCYFPARRASRLDPAAFLRSE